MLRQGAVIAVFCCWLHAADWPRFRGPNGSGVDLSSKSLPAEFGPAKNLVWKTAVPFAHSSPIVAGGKLFLTAGENGRLATLCYDVRNGRLLWRREVENIHRQTIYKSNDPASPSAAADADSVYVFFPDNGLIAYTHAGAERWRHALGPFDNFYGMASSPIVEGDQVILLCDQNSGSFLLSLDKRTGKRKWRTERPGMLISWSAPAVQTPADGQKLLVVIGTSRVDAYYFATGERRWWFPIGSDGAMGTPVFYGDAVIAYSSGQDRSSYPSFDSVLAKYDKDKDGRLSLAESKDVGDWAEHFGWFDADKSGYFDAGDYQKILEFGAGEFGAVLLKPGTATGLLPPASVSWRVKRNLPHVPSPVLYKGTYFMVRDGGIVTSIDPETGAIVKQGRAAESLGPYFASPVAADDKVFLLSEAGKLTVLAAKPEWEVLAVNELGDEAYATPAIVDGRIYVRTRSTLFCFGSR